MRGRGLKRLAAAATLAVAGLAILPGLAPAATLTVDDDRAQCGVADYTTLQAAVTAASNFDTIHICAGTYSVAGGPSPSSGLRIEKNLTIAGAGASKVFIQPVQGTGSIVQGTPNPRDEYGNVITVRRRTIELTDVKLSGFTVRSGDVAVEAGIAVIDVNQSSISGVRVDGISGDPGAGIVLANTIEATNNLATVDGVQIAGFGKTGIHVDNRLLNGAGSVGNGSVMDARISSTSISGSGGPASQNGIEAFGSGAKVTLTKSAIAGTGAPDGSAAAIELHGIDAAHSLIGGSLPNANHLKDNVYGAWNGDAAGTGLSGSALSAGSNYWSPAAGTPPVSGQVTFNPVSAAAPPAPTLAPVADAPPALQWDSPEDGGPVLAGQANSLGAVATDDFGITSVTFAVDGSPLGTGVTPPVTGGRVYTYSWAPPLSDAGATHTLTATATDEAGQTASKSITVHVYAAPFFSGMPEITGTTQGYAGVGVQLTCGDGGPGGDPAPSVTYQWLAAGAPVGTNSNHYAPTAADQGKQITCKVTLQNPGGKLSKTSDPVPVASPPAFTAGPAITSTSSSSGVGTLTCSATASGGPVPGLAYQWLRDGIEIANENDPVYTYSAATDNGHTLTCRVRATNSAGQIEASVAAPPQSAPSFVAGPVITGLSGGYAVTGSPLTCTNTPGGFPSPNVAYAWFNGATQISGQTQQTYTPTTGVQGAAISCRVTLTNVAGSANQTSAAVTVANNPAFSTGAAVTGADLPGYAFAGTVLTCSATATGTPVPAVTYEWLKDGTAIPAQTATSYTVDGADVGHVIACKATATGVGNPATSTSPGTTAAAVPAFTTSPSVTGTTGGYAITDQALSCSAAASGFPVPTLAYEWLADGDSVGTGATYTPAIADQGKALVCKVTASSAVGGPVTESSGPATVATPISFSQEAEIAGQSADPLAVAGDELTCVAVADGDPAPALAYRWQLDGADLPGEADDTYLVTAADAGHELTCVATATVASPAGMGESTATITVATPPAFGGAPELGGLVDGYAVAGEELTCSDGDPAGDPAPDVLYAFEAGGDPVGTGAPAYTPAAADEGKEITCTVTLTNAAGQIDAATEPVTVATTPTVDDVTIDGASGAVAAPGDELTCTAVVEGDPEPDVAHTWLANGTPIPDADTATFVVTAAEAGAEIECLVTATNIAGSASDSSSVDAGIPPAGEKPTVSGAAKVGSTLSCEHAPWTGVPEPELAYAWLRDGAPVAGESGTSYKVPVSDAGAAIACRVSAETSTGELTKDSDAVTIAAAPAGALAGPKAFTPGKLPLAIGTIVCEVGPCTVTAPAQVPVRIGKKTYRLPVTVTPSTLGSGETAKVTVTVPKKARKALAKGRKAKPVTIVVSYSGGGADGTTSFTFRLTAPKAKQPKAKA